VNQAAVMPVLDDTLCHRLKGLALPPVRLASTQGDSIDLSALPSPRTVIYCYPRTSEPGQPSLAGWDVIPGAKGCTPQACSFRDHHADLAALGAAVFGLSTQPTAYQQDMAARLHLPFAVLSDAQFGLTEALGLPTFEAGGMRLIQRLTLVLRDGAIEAVFYPVSQPEQSAAQVIEWLEANPL
jgi:peroxiredoxin